MPIPTADCPLPTACPVYGVDFSGGAGAGRKIWIAAGAPEGETLRITGCLRAADLPGGGPERERALTALRRFIAGRGACAVGLDFPFGLPWELVPDGSWTAFVRAFAGRYPTAAVFRGRCAAAAAGRELRRLTDREARTPFCPYNIRLYRQTYHGIRDLLAPLVCDGAVCVLPMQPARAGLPWLVEICPASALKRLGLYVSYKGRGAERARARLLDELAARRVALPPEARSAAMADSEGDALDSLIAAYATARALRGPWLKDGDGQGRYLVEGFVYA